MPTRFTAGGKARQLRVGTAWRMLKRARINSGSSPWDFDSVGTSSAASSVTLNTTSPAPYEGAGFFTCTSNGADGANGFARGQFTLALRSDPTYIKCSFSVYLPSDWETAIVSGGTAQIWRLDPFPTLNSGINLLYSQAADAWRLVVKDNNVDRDITDNFIIAPGAWRRVEIQLKLSQGNSGWVKVSVDGSMVASTRNTQTLYSVTDGSGSLVSRCRVGLVALGTGQTTAVTVHVDDIKIDLAPTAPVPLAYIPPEIPVEMPASVLDLAIDSLVYSNNAARFTKANTEYLSAAHNGLLSFPGDQSFSLCGMMIPQSAPGTDFWTIIGKWSGTAAQQQYLMGWRGSQSRFSLLVNNGASVFAQPPEITSLTVGTPYFLLGYHDATNNVIGLSVNNGTRTTAAQAGSLQTSTAQHEIGRSNSSAIHYADAIIQGVGVFTGVLSTTEQAWLYNAGLGRRFSEVLTQPDLLAKCVSWMDLSEPSGTRYDRVSSLEWTDNNTVTSAIGLASAAAMNRDPISSWTDASPAARNAAQTTLAARPLFRTSRTITMKPAAIFDGTDDALALSSALTHTGDFTHMYVKRYNAGGAILGHSTGSGRLVHTLGTTLTLTNDAGTSLALTHPDVIGLDFQVFVLRRAGSTVTLHRNGVLADTDTLSGTVTFDQIGRHGAATSPLNGEMTKILAYNAALTDSQISTITTSAMTTWGVS